MEEEKESKSKILANKIITIILVSFFVLITALSVYFTYMKSHGKSVSLFGYSISYVLTGSMENILFVGDVILLKQIPQQEIKKDDIITYKSMQEPLKGQYITHRVIEVKQHTNGTIQYITKGDKSSGVDTEFITYSNIYGVYQRKLVILTLLFSVLTNFYVFFLLIILPLLVVLALQLKNFITAYNEHKED